MSTYKTAVHVFIITPENAILKNSQTNTGILAIPFIRIYVLDFSESIRLFVRRKYVLLASASSACHKPTWLSYQRRLVACILSPCLCCIVLLGSSYIRESYAAGATGEAG